jgi:hypothetical protein
MHRVAAMFGSRLRAALTMLRRTARISSEGEAMAEPNIEKIAHGATASDVSVSPVGDGRAAVIDLQSLAQVLNGQAKAIALALGEVIGDKLADLKKELRSETKELRRAEDRIAELTEKQNKIEQRVEHALGQQRGEDWLAKHPPGDREHLKGIDEKLRELEKTLEGPEVQLERGDGENRPPVTGRATWQLPEYQPVPPDFGGNNT